MYMWVCCVALLCCLFDLACFFLPSFSSLIKTCITIVTSLIILKFLSPVSDAAHSVQPLVGLGLSLGLGDVVSLTALLLQAHATGEDWGVSLLHVYIINPRRACAARVTVVVLCVCPSVRLSVRLFVHDYSRTTGYEAAYERYQHLQCYKGTKIKLAILLKRLRSRDMA